MYNFRYARICENNHLDDATVASSPLAGFEFANALDLKNRNTEFRPDSNVFTLEIDLKANKRVSFLSIIGPSDGFFGISDDALITIKGNMINLFDGSEAYSSTVSVQNLGAFLNISDIDNPFGIELRFWQISVDDSLNPNPVKINYLYLGDHLQFIHNVNNGFTFQPFDLSSKRFSSTGKAFTVRKPQQRLYSGTGISFINKQDRIELLQRLEQIGTIEPFLFVLDPEEKQLEYDFNVTPAYFDRSIPQFNQVRLDFWDVSFTLREVL